MAPDIAFYAARFEQLKLDGCAILVTGDVSATAQRAVARTLLGAPDEPRRRVLALTDPSVGDPADLLPVGSHPADGEQVRVLDHRETESAADAAFEDSPFAPPGADALDDLHLAVHTALAAVEPDDPAGGEVRLSVAGLVPLLRRHDDEAVERFVRATAAHVRGLCGMAHYLLPVADGAGWARRLVPEFDVRVEVREPAADGPPEHRWHFPERDRPSPWRDLPLDAGRGWMEP